ncbi:hypothetical protein N431DRAFT_457765 [Stipitochalara longipes BDJ]|nr:hypothetical protein N431DRAFT_457765 [Stipitochalara longipes BDJ]
MSTSFLFVNEDERSYPVRPKRTLTSVRRHVRLQRGRNTAQQRQLELEIRALPPKALQVCTSKANEAFTLRTSTKLDQETRDPLSENLIKPPFRLGGLPAFKISHRIWQRYPDACKLIIFYFSGEGSQAHLSLRCTTQWSTMVIQKALESESHTLFLLCYISSIVTYQESLAKDQRISSDSRHSSQASDTSSSSSSFSATLDDWEFTYPSETRVEPYTSPLSSTFSHTLPQPRPFTISQLSQPSQSSQASLAPNFVNRHFNHTTQLDKPGLSTPSLSHGKARHSAQAIQIPLASQLSPLAQVPSNNEPQPCVHTPGYTQSYTLPSDPIHLTHQAVATLKSRLSTKLKSSPPPPLSEFLFPVWCLFRSAILQNDRFAAGAHEKFLRHLLYKSDGATGVPPWLLRIIVEVDLKLGASEGSDDMEGKSRCELILESEMRERGDKRFGLRP